ncbi:MAG: hypothetical protein ACRCXN_12280, partial [Bacteroidales bacterium]
GTKYEPEPYTKSDYRFIKVYISAISIYAVMEGYDDEGMFYLDLDDGRTFVCEGDYKSFMVELSLVLEDGDSHN